MGKKIFVSYKYNDNDVKDLASGENSTPHDYVQLFAKNLSKTDDIFKGEHNDEDLSNLSDDEIWEKLKNKIYDSSVTIIFISPNMRDASKKDRDQWIPWEVEYSLRETSRINKNGDPVKSNTNAMLAVVLPDSNGDYSYFWEQNDCCDSPCLTQNSGRLFNIIRKNMFNHKNPDIRKCPIENKVIWTGANRGYIEAVKWSKFKYSYREYIDKACDRQDRLNEFDLCKEV